MSKGRAYKIQEIATYIITYCLSNDIQINHFKIQKLLYYIQSWHLVYFNSLIFEDKPQAWVNGPVYRSIYDLLKDKAKPYTALGVKDSTPEKNFENYNKLKETLKLEQEQDEFLNSIMDYYGIMAHEKLILLTHQEKPWKEAREGLGNFDYSDRPISFDTMHKYYSSKVAQK